MRVWSPLATAGKVVLTSAAFPASSVTVTVTVAVAALAAVGVPLITPVTSSISSPAGNPAAAYDPMSSLAPVGWMAVMLSPTCNEVGAV